MAEASSNNITTDLMDEPHIAGRRISVLHVYDWVEGRGDSPKEVAETFDLDVADVYYALAYYDDNPEEMKAHRQTREEAFERITERVEEDRPPGVEPPN